MHIQYEHVKITANEKPEKTVLTRGDTYKHDEEYLEFLNEYYNQSNAELLQVCEGKSPELYKRIINDELHLLANEIDEKQKTINVGEGVEKTEPSYTVGGTINWGNHHGKKHGVSSKN